MISSTCSARRLAAAADGAQQTDHWNPAAYASGARYVSALGADLVDLLDPRPGERILDIGCGDGHLTLAIAERGAETVGWDASPEMVRAARARGVDARLGRAEDLDFERAFDAAFSNAALHWAPDADAVLAGISHALRPGGRLVVEQGGQGNVEAVRLALAEELERSCGLVTDLSDIWYFPSVEEHAVRLERAGFEVASIDLFPRPTEVGTSMETWLCTLAAPVLALAPRDERPEIVRRVTARLARRLCRRGRWTVDYVRLRYRASLSSRAA